MSAAKPLARFSKKIARLITSGTGTPPNMQVLGSIGSKGACLRMREIVTIRRLFFPFFDLMRFATDRPVGPIIAVNGSNDAPCWPSRPFYCFVNKKYFPHFLPKNVTNCITPYVNFEQL